MIEVYGRDDAGNNCVAGRQVLDKGGFDGGVGGICPSAFDIKQIIDAELAEAAGLAVGGLVLGFIRGVDGVGTAVHGDSEAVSLELIDDGVG